MKNFPISYTVPKTDRVVVYDKYINWGFKEKKIIPNWCNKILNSKSEIVNLVYNNKHFETEGIVLVKNKKKSKKGTGKRTNVFLDKPWENTSKCFSLQSRSKPFNTTKQSNMLSTAYQSNYKMKFGNLKTQIPQWKLVQNKKNLPSINDVSNPKHSNKSNDWSITSLSQSKANCKAANNTPKKSKPNIDQTKRVYNSVHWGKHLRNKTLIDYNPSNSRNGKSKLSEHKCSTDNNYELNTFEMMNNGNNNSINNIHPIFKPEDFENENTSNSNNNNNDNNNNNNNNNHNNSERSFDRVENKNLTFSSMTKIKSQKPNNNIHSKELENIRKNCVIHGNHLNHATQKNTQEECTCDHATSRNGNEHKLQTIYKQCKTEWKKGERMENRLIWNKKTDQKTQKNISCIKTVKMTQAERELFLNISSWNQTQEEDLKKHSSTSIKRRTKVKTKSHLSEIDRLDHIKKISDEYVYYNRVKFIPSIQAYFSEHDFIFGKEIFRIGAAKQKKLLVEMIKHKKRSEKINALMTNCEKRKSIVLNRIEANWEKYAKEKEMQMAKGVYMKVNKCFDVTSQGKVVNS